MEVNKSLKQSEAYFPKDVELFKMESSEIKEIFY